MKYLTQTGFIVLVMFVCCGQQNPATSKFKSDALAINDSGQLLYTRFNPPQGFERKVVATNSFAHYLRNLPLKPSGSKVKHFDGTEKEADVYHAVIAMDIGNKDLQQCADAVIRLRAEYLYAQKSYDRISFRLTNGFKVNYTEWMKGNRVQVKGNETRWKKTASPSNTYRDFRAYLDLVFTYAGSLSLSKELKLQAMKDIAVGDVFIYGGTPGHAVIVVDVAQNTGGEKVFMLAQSYMPAQEIQVLKNPGDEKQSPWYSSSFVGDLETPQWTFSRDQLMTW